MTPTPVPVGTSELTVFPLGLGTNIFSDPSDPAPFHAVLDGFVERGGTFVDTADMYSHWVPGNTGGESEDIIGRWMADRRNRDDVVVATKVAAKPDRLGLSPATVKLAAEESLRRLRTDHIDLYYAHYQDDETPVVDSAAAFDRLVTEGKVRAVGLSNLAPEVIDEWFRVCAENGFAAPVALQPRYSLVSREYEGGLADAARRHGMSVFPYQVLAGGFLTGKYRTEADTEGRARAGAVKRYLTPQGLRVLDALDSVARDLGTRPASVALAWAMAGGKVTAPLAAATTTDQLDQLFAAVSLELPPEHVARLDEVSATFR